MSKVSETVKQIENKINELRTKRYPFSIFAGKTIQKHGTSLVDIKSKDQLIRVFEYVKSKFEKQDTNSVIGSELGFGVTESEKVEFFMDATLDEITSDFKLQGEYIRDIEKMAQLEEALEMTDSLKSKKDIKEEAMAKINSLLS